MAALADLAAEALAGAEDGGDIEKQIEQALACPCIGSLKEGPCGSTFVEAFSCFIRSDHEDKGMDCVPQFGAFQTCLQAHPTHVEALMLDAEEAVPESSDNGPKPPEST